MAQLTRRAGPLAELADLQSRFDRMFDDMLDRGGGDRTLAIDVIDEDDAIVVRADVPGIKPDEVEVQVQDDLLTVRGKHEERAEEKGKRFMRRERRWGAFTRSIALPPGVDPDAIKASCQDGVVEVRVPKPERSEPRTIQIGSGSES